MSDCDREDFLFEAKPEDVPVSLLDADPAEDQDWLFQVMHAARLERENLEVQAEPQLSVLDHEVLHSMLAVE